MRRRHSQQTESVEVAPVGHVRLTCASATLPHRRRTFPTGPGSWAIRDATGELVGEGFSNRAEALRMVGFAALQGAELPLSIVGPDGTATGDCLAG